MFDSLALLAGGLGSTSARGEDVAREPSLSNTAEEVPAPAKGKGGPAFRATVDVYFHVVTDGATGAVSDDAVRAQMQVLNKDYVGQEGGYPTGFSFRLAAIDRTDNAVLLNAGLATSGKREMKKTSIAATPAT